MRPYCKSYATLDMIEHGWRIHSVHKGFIIYANPKYKYYLSVSILEEKIGVRKTPKGEDTLHSFEERETLYELIGKPQDEIIHVEAPGDEIIERLED